VTSISGVEKVARVTPQTLRSPLAVLARRPFVQIIEMRALLLTPAEGHDEEVTGGVK
jgi:hypothetical protein